MVLFGKRKSDGWHLQVTATAGNQHPTSRSFPWAQLQTHTDLYLKKKGKLTPEDVDTRLTALINGHEDRDVAIAACASLMSSKALWDLLNIEVNVAQVTYYGLYTYLQSLIAVNYRGPHGTVSDLEAKWAQALISYSTPGPDAARRFLEGVTDILRDKTLQNLQALPNFAILTRRALVDFAAGLEGFKLKNQWVAAHSSVDWLSNILNNPTPASHSRLGPEELLDSQLPSWRIWAVWKPDLDRLRLFEALPSQTKAVLAEVLALEGPDFLATQYSSLREAFLTCIKEIKQTRIRYGALTIEAKTQTAEELKTILTRLGSCLEAACKKGTNSIELFVYLCDGQPVTQEALQIMIGTDKLSDLSVIPSVFKIVRFKDSLGREYSESMSCLLPALEGPSGELLRGVLCPYLVEGIHNCIHEMQALVGKSIEDGKPIMNGIMNLQKFGQTVKDTSSLHTLLDASVRALLQRWPTDVQLHVIFDIRRDSLDEGSETPTSNPLTRIIDMFFGERLIQSGALNASSTRLLDLLTTIWTASAYTSRQKLAILVARSVGMETNLRVQCLEQVLSLPNPFVVSFLGGMTKYQEEPDIACIDLTEILAMNVDVAESWRYLLLRLIDQRSTTLLDFALNSLAAERWLLFLQGLNIVFGDIIRTATAISPPVLQPSLHAWAQTLADYVPTITHLEKALAHPDASGSPAIRCILNSGESYCIDLVHILESVKKYMDQDGPILSSMHWTLKFLAEDGSNVHDISEALLYLSTAAPDCVDVYERLIEVHQETPKDVLEVFIAGWLQDLVHNDRKAIKALAKVLYLETSEDIVIGDARLKAAAAYVEKQVEEVLKEATRLDSLRGGLKARDPKRTTALLASLGIEDSSPLDDEFEDMAPEMADLIERYGDNEVELSFPISHLSDLTKAALGVGDAQSVLVRLVIDVTEELPPGFCIHLGDETEIPDSLAEHYPYMVLKGEDLAEDHSCHGRVTRMTWQLSRILARRLQKKGYTSLPDIHKFITKQIDDLAHGCVVCGTPHGARARGSREAKLRRPIPCQTAKCSTIWNRACLDVRLTDIRVDPNTVDMLLLGIHAATVANRMDLLPGCPIKATHTISAVLDALPALSTFKTANNISTALRASHSSAEQLLTWVLSSYRGYLASTSGILKIPGMPGAHQFILANAAPELEAAFAAKVGRNGTTKVLFHGTSLDRLPGILSQGLRIGSGSTLQRNGAAHGNGIYMADDPSTSFSYSPTQAGWRNSAFHNHRVLLGCELAGNGNVVSPGIHVIKDPGTLMVRYVFLFNNTAQAPLTIHISPAMLSAFSALRKGTV